MEWLELEYLGNSVGRWLAASVAALVTLVAVTVAKRTVSRGLSSLARRTTVKIDDLVVALLGATRPWVMVAIALYVGAQVPQLPENIRGLIGGVLVVALAVQVILWGNLAISFWLATRFVTGEQAPGEGAEQPELQLESSAAFGAVGFVARLLLYSAVVLLALDNLGVDISALLAGIGVGGIAIALATQNVLGDVFNSLSIVLDKPFEVGDFIVVGDVRGNVERIGVKTTRLRSLQGEQIVFANSDLVGSRIQNYKSMKERRVQFQFGVTYQTSADQLAAIPDMVRDIMAAVGSVRLDRVHFQGYGDFALIFEVVYYIQSADYVAFMDKQQEINLELF
ncbi:MAG: mechanosensitive ion channel family protein, partial [Candidatus Binatia bacterium]